MEIEENETVTVDCLPVEIQEDILLQDALTIKDVVSFSSTSKRFREIVNGSNKLWKKKFFQRWPSLQHVFDTQMVQEWKTEVCKRIEMGLFVQKKLSEFSAKFIIIDEIADVEFEDFKFEMRKHYLNYCYMLDELKELFASHVDINLTTKYYGSKVMRFLKQEHLKQVWLDFINLPSEEQLLETGALFVAQWFQPMIDVTSSEMTSFCDEVAEKVKLLVQSCNSSHSLLKVSPEQLNEWRCRNIRDNQFSPMESKQILSALCSVVFQQYGFCADNEKCQSLETSMFNCVIEHKKGTALMISIIIESIARRLGVKCEIVVFPSHLLLRWREKYDDSESDGISPPNYIDVFNGGNFLTKRNCPRFYSSGECPMKKQRVGAANVLQVVEFLASDVLTAVRRERSHSGKSSRVRAGVDLLVVVNPFNLYNVLHAARFYTDYQLDANYLLEIVAMLQKTVREADRLQLQQFSHSLSEHSYYKAVPVPLTPKRNNGTVKYAIGMIMKHRQYGYRCVIYGWDYHCKATPEWILQMGVSNLEYKTNQPFYNVLVSDGSTRYAAQENLELHPDPQRIEHPLVGRYFDMFCSTYYMPNKEKTCEYPDDEDVRTRHLMCAGMMET